MNNDKILRLAKAKEYAQNKGGDCLSTEYLGAKKELTWKCANNHIWNTKYKSVVLDNSWCPQCSAYYYKERESHRPKGRCFFF